MRAIARDVVVQQLVTETIEAGGGEAGEFSAADEVGNVAGVLAVLRQRRRLATLQRHALDPVLRRLRHGDRLRRRRVHASAHVDADLIGVLLGLLLALKSLDMPVAVLVDVVGDPRLLWRILL